jgi:hypothetical protein
MRKMERFRNQQNGKAHNGKRAQRRTKLGLRIRSLRDAGTVNPRSKTSIFQMLTISNVPSHVLNAIDELAAGQDRSRSSFIRCELQRIVAGYQAKAAW